LRDRAEVDPGTAPAVSEVKDPQKGVPCVAKLCRSILPTGVGLRDWIEHRIAHEVEVQWDDTRGCSVLVLLDTPEDCDPSVAEGTDHNTSDGAEGASESMDVSAVKLRHHEIERQSQPKVECFMETLPPDTLTACELELREALFDFLDRYEEQHPGIAPPVSQAGSKTAGDPLVRRLCSRLLPKNVGLRHWINYRIAEELQAPFDDERRCSVIIRV